MAFQVAVEIHIGPEIFGFRPEKQPFVDIECHSAPEMGSENRLVIAHAVTAGILACRVYRRVYEICADSPMPYISTYLLRGSTGLRETVTGTTSKLMSSE